ncbi:hypothetical protein GCM10010121_095150 [Streptomyces brasiliensis]|uniref:Uncharacterized protein n=1 Tax=Streptomyces brasiliensis TaxID=1954 RepID=A0A917UN21_9ACTN|nr:hypothetical protein GCM10010121_095150 [Streptomyces brasiliensis]
MLIPTRTVRLGKRPHPVPLDPASWTVLQRCLAHREAWRTDNLHVMVTKGRKVGRSPASTACLSHVLDGCGFPPRMIRSTRLVDLVNTMDPKLVAAAFGMDPQATLIYLADTSTPGAFPITERQSASENPLVSSLAIPQTRMCARSPGGQRREPVTGGGE